jgi:hypothetical protein
MATIGPLWLAVVVGIGVVRGSPDDLEGLWPGLSRRSTSFGASNARERGKVESFERKRPAPHVSPVFEALPAWIAGTSPAHDDKG